MSCFQNKMLICEIAVVLSFVSLKIVAAPNIVHEQNFFEKENSKSVVVTKYNNSQLESFQEFDGGSPSGIYESWWKNGKRKVKAFYVNGKENGALSLWYKNGNIQLTGGMKNGELDGETNSWFESGEKRTKEIYVEGKRVDVWISWYKNKKRSSMITFNSGEIIQCVEWSKESKITYEGKNKARCEDVFTKNYTISMESEDPE